MKASEFRMLIREEIRRVLKESVTRVAIESANDLTKWSAFKKLGNAFTDIKLASDKSYFKKYTAQLDLDKLKMVLGNGKSVSIGKTRKDTVPFFIDGVLAFDLVNLDANTFNMLKQLVKPVEQKLNTVTDYVEAIADMASSGGGAATELQSEEFTNIVKKIKASNLTNAVDKALVKYINNTRESFTIDDVEALQRAGFDLKQINYATLAN